MADVHRVGPFILGKTLGHGSTGKVKLAFHVETGYKVAVKIIERSFLEERPTMIRKLEREIAVMRLIDHPNVLRLFDVYETDKSLFLILEYSPGGELFDYLVRKGALEQEEAIRFFHQLIEGLYYCHLLGICHRDLKPENLLLDAEDNIKIADFGMAALKKPGLMLETSCGSPHYASPEVVMGNRYEGAKADVWSCGVILYALVTGKLPFDDENIRKLLAKVKAGVFTIPQFLHPQLHDLISKMLIVEPEERISLEEVRKHPWYRSKTIPVNKSLSRLEDMPTGPVAPNDITPSALRSLRALDFGTDEIITANLTREEPNLTKSYFYLIKEREDSLDKLMRTKKKLGRAKSEYGMASVNPSKSIPSEDDINLMGSNEVALREKKESQDKLKKVQRRKSMGGGSAIFKRWKVLSPENSSDELKDKESKEKEELSDDSSSDSASTPRKWFSSLFQGSSSSLSLQTQLYTPSNLVKCAKELENVFTQLSVPFHWNTSKTRVKSKHTVADSKTVRMETSISKIDETTFCVEFHKRSGERSEFATLINTIYPTLLLRLGSVSAPIRKRGNSRVEKPQEKPTKDRTANLKDSSRKRAQFWRSTSLMRPRAESVAGSPPSSAEAPQMLERTTSNE